MSNNQPGFDTLAIHAGAQPDPATGARATPIYQTTAFVFDDADHAASLFGLKAFGNIYTRIMNPTQAVLEERVAALEGGTAALAVASGHAAQLIVFHTIMSPGDNFVAANRLYGGSINQFGHSFKNFGWEVRWADVDKPETIASQIDERTKAIFIESFANPAGFVTDIEAMAKIAHDHGIPLIEDDIYGDLHFGPERPLPVKALDGDGLVLYCGSFSKTLAPGLRVGWVAAGRYTEQARRLKFISSTTTPSINQLAIARYLESAAMERHLRGLRQAFRTQVAQVSEAIVESFPSGTALSQPAGGFYLWVQLPEGVNALDLHRLAAEENITISPGQIFCPHTDILNRIRISCGYPCDARIRKSIHTLGQLVRKLEAHSLRPGQRG